MRRNAELCTSPPNKSKAKPNLACSKRKSWKTHPPSSHNKISSGVRINLCNKPILKLIFHYLLKSQTHTHENNILWSSPVSELVRGFGFLTHWFRDLWFFPVAWIDAFHYSFFLLLVLIVRKYKHYYKLMYLCFFLLKKNLYAVLLAHGTEIQIEKLCYILPSSHCWMWNCRKTSIYNQSMIIQFNDLLLLKKYYICLVMGFRFYFTWAITEPVACWIE